MQTWPHDECYDITGIPIYTVDEGQGGEDEERAEAHSMETGVTDRAEEVKRTLHINVGWAGFGANFPEGKYRCRISYIIPIGIGYHRVKHIRANST